MIAEIENRPALTVKDLKGHADPEWCPGCGDFGVLHALKQAIVELGLYPDEVLTISGIGCSSNLPGFINTYGMHTLHGRSLAVATGAQLANHKLKVIVTGGDGDGYGIGGNHFLHTMRRNVDLTYIVMDNQIYGLTKGQLSPTSQRGRKTVTSSFGSLEDPVNPLLYVLSYGASFVAQGTPADMAGLAKVIEEGIRFPGFAFINVQSPCVTYGQEDQQLKAQKSKMQSLESLGHDSADWASASARAREYGTKLYTGVLYRNPNPPRTYGDGVTERQQALKKQAVPRHELLNRFMPNT
jgi:2-oxoglutarate/2-oxoacid ferredoxin oxidoreductase subunit beta